MRKGFWTVLAHIFFLSSILFVPYPYFIFRFQKIISEFIFLPIIKLYSRWSGAPANTSSIDSDSVAMHWLFSILFAGSIFIALLVFSTDKWRKISLHYLGYASLLIRLFLIFHLAKYGADKLFLNQFYTPEANILFTEFGKLDPDILYWSVMGLSPGYSIFLGLAEVAAAALLCFGKTKNAGLILAIGILANVVAVNVGFDISVKLFSSLLLCIAIFLFFIRNEPSGKLFVAVHPIIKYSLTIFLSLVLLIEIAFPLILVKNNKPNGFAGGYEVVRQTDANPTVSGMKRFFIHKDGYFIVENNAGQFTDYKLLINEETTQFFLRDYEGRGQKINFIRSAGDSVLQLISDSSGAAFNCIGRKINTTDLPSLKHKRHF